MSLAMQNLNFIVSLTDRMSAPMGRITQSLDSVQKKTQGGLLKVGIGTAGIAGIGYTIGKVTEKAIAFESAMADVRKVTNFPTPEGLKQFGDELLRMSHTIPLSAENLAQIATAGGQLGVAENNLMMFTQIVAKMSTAFDMLPEAAGESIAKLSNIFHIPIDKMEQVGDAINYLDNNMAAKSRDIVDVLARIGGTSQLLGLTVNQATALSAAMLSLGQTPELAGTSINALLLRLGTARNQSKDFIGALGDIGLSVDQLEANLKSGGAQATINDFLARISKLDKAAQLQTLGQLFGAEYSDNLGILVGGLDQYRNALGLVNKESKFQGSMQQEFAIRSATTANHLQRLKNIWDDLIIKVGYVFLPMINNAVDKMSQVMEPVINGMQYMTKNFPRLTEFIAKFTGLGVVIGVVGFAVLAIGGLLSMLASPLLLLGAGLAAISTAVMTFGLVGIGQAVIDLTGYVLQFFGVFGAVDWLLAKWEALKAWWSTFSFFMAALRPFELLYGGAVLAIGAIVGVFQQLYGWWTNLKLWLAGLNPFGLLVAGAFAVVDSIVAGLERLKGWWAGFKGWLASLNPFAGIGDSLNGLMAKVSGLANIKIAVPSPVVGNASGGGAGGNGGLLSKAAAAVNNSKSTSKTVNLTVNNHGKGTSPAEMEHHFKMAGG